MGTLGVMESCYRDHDDGQGPTRVHLISVHFTHVARCPGVEDAPGTVPTETSSPPWKMPSPQTNLRAPGSSRCHVVRNSHLLKWRRRCPERVHSLPTRSDSHVSPRGLVRPVLILQVTSGGSGKLGSVVVSAGTCPPGSLVTHSIRPFSTPSRGLGSRLPVRSSQKDTWGLFPPHWTVSFPLVLFLALAWGRHRTWAPASRFLFTWFVNSPQLARGSSRDPHEAPELVRDNSALNPVAAPGDHSQGFAAISDPVTSSPHR